MVDENNLPYVLPFNFGYKDGEIFLHSSQKGHKIDILRKNPAVCIAFSTDHQLRYQSNQVACSYSMKYRSVLAFGQVEFIDDIDKKADFFNTVMSHYTDREFTYNAPALREVCTYKVKVEKFTAKIYGY
jgi:nitroimidazol reductase NimA-like FMN-containing flavoprotein (pyridoxamine 5'-phosphate oxidase superfamily)